MKHVGRILPTGILMIRVTTQNRLNRSEIASFLSENSLADSARLSGSILTPIIARRIWELALHVLQLSIRKRKFSVRPSARTAAKILMSV